MPRRRSAPFIVLVSLSLLVVSCGDDDEGTATTGPETSVTTTTSVATTTTSVATTTTSVATTTTTTAIPETTTTTVAPETTTTTAAGAGGAFVGAYAFPPGIVETGYNRQPSRLEAVIGIPEGEGPFPIAVFLHGLGYDCTGIAGLDPNSYVTTPWAPPCTLEGSEYLRNAFVGTAIVEQLAQAGVVAVSIDVNAGYFWYGGEAGDVDVIDPLIAEHLRIVDEIASGAIRLDGRDGTFAVDPTRYALIGHSRGGGFVEATLAPSSPERPFVSPTPQVAVLVGSAGHFDDPEVTVPLLNVRAGCDADVGSDAGLETAEKLAALGAGIVLDAEVVGSSHWAMTSVVYGDPRSDCADVVDPEIAETQVAQLVGSFVAGVFAGDLSVPIDETRIVLTALAGDLPPTVEPSPGTGLEPAAVPITEIDEARLPAISPDDPFADESALEDF